MGHQTHASFTLQDLGLLVGPPIKGFDAVVSLASNVLRTPKVALLMIDVENGSIFLRASHGFDQSKFPLFGFPYHGSISSKICNENKTLQISNVSSATFASTGEANFFGANACLGSPIHDPAGAPVGVLIALHEKTHEWTDTQIEELEAFAYLASQQIMLKASFETLRLMKREILLA